MVEVIFSSDLFFWTCLAGLFVSFAPALPDTRPAKPVREKPDKRKPKKAKKQKSKKQKRTKSADTTRTLTQEQQRMYDTYVWERSRTGSSRAGF